MHEVITAKIVVHLCMTMQSNKWSRKGKQRHILLCLGMCVTKDILQNKGAKRKDKVSVSSINLKYITKLKLYQKFFTNVFTLYYMKSLE